LRVLLLDLVCDLDQLRELGRSNGLRLPFGDQIVEATLQIGRDAGVNLEEQRGLVLAEVRRGALGAQGDDLGNKGL